MHSFLKGFMIEVTLTTKSRQTKECIKFNALSYSIDPDYYIINFGPFVHAYPKSIIKDICTLLPI